MKQKKNPIYNLLVGPKKWYFNYEGDEDKSGKPIIEVGFLAYFIIKILDLDDSYTGDFESKSYHVDVVCKVNDDTWEMKTMWAPLLPHQNVKVWDYSLLIFNDEVDRTDSKTKTRDLFDISDELIKESYLVYWFRNELFGPLFPFLNKYVGLVPWFENVWFLFLMNTIWITNIFVLWSINSNNTPDRMFGLNWWFWFFELGNILSWTTLTYLGYLILCYFTYLILLRFTHTWHWALKEADGIVRKYKQVADYHYKKSGLIKWTLIWPIFKVCKAFTYFNCIMYNQYFWFMLVICVILGTVYHPFFFAPTLFFSVTLTKKLRRIM